MTRRPKARFHAYDVFLSHNQDDGSHLLRDALVERGVTAWHDGYADMTDRQVQQRVWEALSKSRYICVCVADGFRDSEWVRVEYATGLGIEERFSIPRVIVALTGSSGQVPEALAGHPRFNVYSEGIKPLVDFLMRENATRTGTADGDEDAHLRNNRKLRDLLSDHSHFKLSTIEQARLARERLELLLAGPPDAAVAFTLSDLAHKLGDAGADRLPLGYDPELQAICMDILEAVSRRPDHVLHIGCMSWQWGSLSNHRIFDPLGQLITLPAHRERALHAFTAICDTLERSETLTALGRRDLPHYRRFARDLAGGTAFGTARRSLTERLQRALHRPWWRFW